jgi:hypothetical protein
MSARVTPHQKWALENLRRLMGSAGTEFLDMPGVKWVSAKDSGAPAAMEHLVRKGFVERRTDTGPRGGELRFYTVRAGR